MTMDYIVSSVNEFETALLCSAMNREKVSVVKFLDNNVVRNFKFEAPFLTNIETGKCGLYLPGMVEVVLAEVI